MKSAGSVYDVLDLDRGVAVKRIGEVDLGTLEWNKYNDANINVFYARVNEMKPSQAKALCSKYLYQYWTSLQNRTDKTLQNHPSLNISYIADVDYDTKEAFKQAMQGVMMYYELATPTETPIDEADLEALRTLQVEAGGTLTFEQSDLHLPVPNQETYLVKVV